MASDHLNMNADLVTSTMYFGEIDNTATIDGGTLRLQQSYVTFGSSAYDPAHPSKMTFKNAARLEVTGDNSKLVADEFDFINSTLMLADNNNLWVRGTLNLDAASVVVGSNGDLAARLAADRATQPATPHLRDPVILSIGPSRKFPATIASPISSVA